MDHKGAAGARQRPCPAVVLRQPTQEEKAGDVRDALGIGMQAGDYFVSFSSFVFYIDYFGVLGDTTRNGSARAAKNCCHLQPRSITSFPWGPAVTTRWTTCRCCVPTAMPRKAGKRPNKASTSTGASQTFLLKNKFLIRRDPRHQEACQRRRFFGVCMPL